MLMNDPSESTTDNIDRRNFVAAAGAGIAGALAGCTGSDNSNNSNMDLPASDQSELGEVVPSFTYTNVAQGQDPAEHDSHVLIAEQMRNLGLDVEMQTFEWGTLFTKVSQQYDFDFSGWLRTLGMYSGTRMPEMFHSRNLDPGAGNFTGHDNPDLDPILEEQLSTSDSERRTELLHQIQEEIADYASINPMFYIPNSVVYDSSQVSGWVDAHREYEFALNMTSIEVTNDENELRGAWSESIDTLNILGWSNQLKIEFHLDQIYDRLVRFGPDLSPDMELSLATDWSIIPEEDTIEYTIREGHTWHDGEPLTAEDVAFSLNYTKEKEVPLYNPQTIILSSAEAIDETTVEVQFNEGEMPGPIHRQFSWRMPIVPKHVWEDVDEPGQRSVDEPIGSGPMEVEYWDRGTELALQRNEDHYMPPSFDRRITRIIPEASTQIELLRSGDLNYLSRAQPQQLDSLLENDQIERASSQGSAFWHYSMNTRNEGVSEKPIRQALVTAAPNSTIVNQVWNGYRNLPEANNIVTPSFGDNYNADVWSPETGIEPAVSLLQENDFGWDSDGNLHYPKE
jgi:peptide/nickel transport system substrate-binding protein